MMKIVLGVIAAALMWPTPQVPPVVAVEYADRPQVAAASRAATTRSESLQSSGSGAMVGADPARSDLWVQVGELAAAGVGTLGASVAVSADGSTVVAGANGAAYVFTKGPSGWEDAVQVARLTTSDGAPGDYFGFAARMSEDGTCVAVGATLKQVGANAKAGAVYVFTRPASGWANATETAKLTASDGGAGDQLGQSLALSADGTTIVAGAQLSNGSETGHVLTAGKAYVFARPATGWASTTETVQLTGPHPTPGDYFAGSLATDLDASTIVVGASGAVYVFARSSAGVASWTETATLTVLANPDGDLPDYVGDPAAVSRDGSTVVAIGASRRMGWTTLCVYVRPASGWVSTSAPAADLTSSDGDVHDLFGVTLAINGDGSLIVAGAPSKRIAGNEIQGQAYTFVRPTTGWVSATESARLLASEGGFGGSFGQSTAVTGDGAVVVLGRTATVTDRQAAAYVFQSGNAGVWVPVASHTDGANGSRWRSDVGVLNPGTVAADVEARLHTPGGILSSRTTVPAGHQVVLDDIVGQIGFTGSAALEVTSDRSVVVTSRTYTPSANGTVGQSYASYRSGEGLVAGQSAWLPQLVENAAYRTNISLTNAGTVPASVDLELHDGTSTLLTTYTVDLAPGEWKQENRPFFTRAGQSAMDQGYAKVTVTAGHGVIATASVADNLTNDPATVEPPLGLIWLDLSSWLPVTSHGTGANGSEWRSDLAILNPYTEAGELTIVLHTADGVREGTISVPPGQTVVRDVVAQFGGFGSAALEVRAFIGVTSRTYTRSDAGTVGQSYRSYGTSEGLLDGRSAWLPQLAENAAYRTNISLTNVYIGPASARVELYDGAGTLVGKLYGRSGARGAEAGEPAVLHEGRTDGDGPGLRKSHRHLGRWCRGDCFGRGQRHERPDDCSDGQVREEA